MEIYIRKILVEGGHQPDVSSPSMGVEKIILNPGEAVTITALDERSIEVRHSSAVVETKPDNDVFEHSRFKFNSTLRTSSSDGKRQKYTNLEARILKELLHDMQRPVPDDIFKNILFPDYNPENIEKAALRGILKTYISRLRRKLPLSGNLLYGYKGDDHFIRRIYDLGYMLYDPEREDFDETISSHVA